MKLQNSYCEKTQNSKCDKVLKKGQIVTKLKNSNGDKNPKLKLWRKSNCDKTQIVTKLKLWRNSNCDKSQVVTVVTVVTVMTKKKIPPKKLFSHFFFFTIFPSFFTKNKFHQKKLKNLNCDETQKLKLWWNLKRDETQKLKLWWNSKKSNCDETQKTQIVKKF